MTFVSADIGDMDLVAILRLSTEAWKPIRLLPSPLPDPPPSPSWSVSGAGTIACGCMHSITMISVQPAIPDNAVSPAADVIMAEINDLFFISSNFIFVISIKYTQKPRAKQIYLFCRGDTVYVAVRLNIVITPLFLMRFEI